MVNMKKVYHSIKDRIFRARESGFFKFLNFHSSSTKFSAYAIFTIFAISVLTLFSLLLLQKTITKTFADQLRIYFLDIGQGDSILIIAPNGNSLLLDSGPPGNSAREEIGKVLSLFDKQIDVFVATHPDSDHIGGFASVADSYNYSAFLDPDFSSDTGQYKNLETIIEGSETLRVVARKGVDVVLDQENGVIIKVLYPDINYVLENFNNCEVENTKSIRTKNKDTQNKSKNLITKNRKKDCSKIFQIDTNEISIVARLEYGSTSVMLTGDAPVSVEHFLLEHNYSRVEIPSEENYLKSNILKVGHHGSKTSTSEEFLEEVNPDYSVISVGADNKYGHPNKEVLDRLTGYFSRMLKIGNQNKIKNDDRSLENKILRTDLPGRTIEFISDGKSIWPVL